MKLNRTTFFGLLALLALYSCKTDDGGGDDYTPINITAQGDTGQVFQNETLEINVLSNDTNVPTSGQLSVNTPQTGTVAILDNGTSSVLDDRILYTPDSSFSGEDTFNYTICDEEGLSCDSASVTITVLPFSPVVLDLNLVPYPNLSDYNFFDGDMANQEPVYGVLPFEPITPLFTDYAKKKRFVWMPTGVSAEYIGDSDLFNFPTGSVLIKNFYYENVQPGNVTQIIETRLLIKKADGWEFADYVWNEAQNEAILDTTGDGGFVPIEWIENGVTRNVNYRIPATSECFTCHKRFFENNPIGTKPQNINSDYAYADGVANQLNKWIEMGYLASNVPANITTVVDWEDESQPLNERMRAYFDINCASCHADSGHCDYRPIRFEYQLTDNPDNMGICIDPDTPIPGYEGSQIIIPGDAENSVLFFRMTTVKEQYRMPLLGRTLQHEEAVVLVEEWINSLTQTCD